MTGDPLALALAVVLVVGALVWALTAAAARLDRLHARVETTRAALDAALLRRAAAAAALADSGELDTASAVLLASAAAEAAPPDSEPGQVVRELAESDLSRALRAVLTPDVVAELHARPAPSDATALLADLSAACSRVVLARRFANDAVVAARRVRAKPVVRWAHLAGRAPLPRTFDVDDEPPALAPAAPGARRGAA